MTVFLFHLTKHKTNGNNHVSLLSLYILLNSDEKQDKPDKQDDKEKQEKQSKKEKEKEKRQKTINWESKYKQLIALKKYM